DAADLADTFSEPQCAVRTCRGAIGSAICRGNREFRNHTGGGDAADLVGGVLNEPHCAVWSHSNESRAAIGGRNREFICNHTASCDATDIFVVRVAWISTFGEPQSAIRPRRDDVRGATGCRDWEFGNGLR